MEDRDQTVAPTLAGQNAQGPVIKEATRLATMPADTDFTEEERNEIGRRAQRLVEKDIRIQAACYTLVIAQRLYNVGLQALNRRMDELEIPQAVEVTLVESMKHAARKEFTREEVFSKLQQHTMPWLAAEVQEAKVRETEVVTEAEAGEDQRRRQVPIPLWFRPSAQWETDPPTLDRTKNMILCGHPKVIQFVLDEIMTVVLHRPPGAYRINVLRLLAELRQHISVTREEGKQFVEVGVNRWMLCGKSLRAVEECLRPWTQRLRKRRVDLLIIDDLAQAIDGPATVPPQGLASNCHRNFRKWADERGAAVIGCLPLHEKDPVIGALAGIEKLDNTWTQLEIYCDLVFLDVRVEDSKYVVTAARHLDPRTEIEIARVPYETIDNPRGTNDNQES